LLVSADLTPRRSERDEMIVNLVEEAGKVDGYVPNVSSSLKYTAWACNVFMKHSDLALS
jgi:hypothetical protein